MREAVSRDVTSSRRWGGPVAAGAPRELPKTTYLKLKNILDAIELLLEPVRNCVSAIGPVQPDLRPWHRTEGEIAWLFLPR